VSLYAMMLRLGILLAVRTACTSPLALEPVKLRLTGLSLPSVGGGLSCELSQPGSADPGSVPAEKFWEPNVPCQVAVFADL
ncbi:unnamed protein product, partial [Polarella glacialis]